LEGYDKGEATIKQFHEMRGRNLTDYEKELIFEKWQERKPLKVIALEMGRSYGCIYFQLKQRSLIG
jgi:hypothetical protein